MLATATVRCGTLASCDPRNIRGDRNQPALPRAHPAHSKSPRCVSQTRPGGNLRAVRVNIPAVEARQSIWLMISEGNRMTYAIGDLIQKQLPHWLAYAQSLTRNRTAAEDLVQDTVVRVLTSIERFDGRSFASWSNTILRNRFIDGYRRSLFQDSSVVDLEGILPRGRRLRRSRSKWTKPCARSTGFRRSIAVSSC